MTGMRAKQGDSLSRRRSRPPDSVPDFSRRTKQGDSLLGRAYWLARTARLQSALESLLALIDDADYLPSDEEWKVIVAARQAAVDRSTT